jgi:hypothetical protein
MGEVTAAMMAYIGSRLMEGQPVLNFKAGKTNGDLKMDTNRIKLCLLSAIVGASLFAGSATAASQCKGLENSACNTNSACGWVDGYQRKDGRKVKSFCRTSARGKAKPQTKAKAVSKVNN